MSSICHCSDRPKLSIERLQNCSLKIDIWNLPKFAYLIKLWIRRGYEELYAMNLVSSLFVLLKILIAVIFTHLCRMDSATSTL